MAVMLLLPFCVYAKQINESEALHKAQAFLSSKGIKHVEPAHLKMAMKGRKARSQQGQTDSPSYYVFNLGQNEGFVIVSGDDSTVEILGYSPEGSLNEGNIPDALRYLLDGYAEQIDWLNEHPELQPSSINPQNSTLHHSIRRSISPLVVTRWSQDSPYYNLCPEINGNRAVTGCVATAMAQVMYFHANTNIFQAQAIRVIPGYSRGSGKNAYTVSELPVTTFNWAAMTPTYSDNSSAESADAVAKLMQYCGAALQMSYSASASSAYNASVSECLKYYFGYDKGVQYMQRYHYNYSEWVDILYAELAAGRPIVLGGQSCGGGHSFVCDGYDAEDYFHINWGWGGSSDGYFKLSALNPYEQGIGGSSTLDGFTFGQDAVVGIKPCNSSDDGNHLSLSLEQFRFTSSTTNLSQTVTRASAEEAFSGIKLYVVVANFMRVTHNFDYAAMLTDEAGNVLQTLCGEDNKALSFNTDYAKAFTGLSTPSGLTDGTYYIKVVSREHSETALEWMDCHDALRQQIKAVVEGNTMTLTAPVSTGVVPTVQAITVDGNLKVGYEHKAIVTVKGGAADYHDALMLSYKTVDNTKTTYTSIVGKQVDIPAGQTVDLTFVFTPTEAGDKTLCIRTSKSATTDLGCENVTFGASDATSDIGLGFSYTLENLTADNKLYGNALRASITVDNPSEDKIYSGTVNCSLRKWTCTDNGDNTCTWSWQGLGVTSFDVNIDKNGQEVLSLARNDLEKGAYYSVRVTYKRVTGSSTIDEGVHIGLSEGHGTLEVADGYSLGDRDGSTTVYDASTPIDAGSSCFVDLRAMSSLDGVNITPSSNPNCVYLLNDGATVPAALSDCNVIVGNTAETISLSDGADFCCPVDFSAQTISYTRTFNLAANGTSGWMTLMLPFDVETVTCEGNTLDWFHSADDVYKNFWLQQFVSDEYGVAYFDYTNKIEANTPYIIAVPGENFGETWRLTGKPITFTAENADIAATIVAGDVVIPSVCGNYFNFCGTTTRTTVENIYGLNASGSMFVRAASATPPAFRAWIKPVSISSLSLASLAIGNVGTTGIHAIDNGQLIIDNGQSDGWYTLDGRRLSGKPTQKGIYIVNGKKVVLR